MMKKSHLCIVFAGIAGAAFAQTAPAPYAVHPYVKGEKSSILSTLPALDNQTSRLLSLGGVQLNTIDREEFLDRDSAYITVEEVGRDEGDWIILRFSEFELGGDGSLTVRSLADGESQTFDQEYLEQSGGYTPMFKGGVVSVQLNKNEEDEGVFYLIDSMLIGTPPSPENTYEGFPPTGEQMVEPVEAICGADNRSTSNDDRIGRIMPVGCTGWAAPGGIFATAGHCMRGNRMLVLQTNVPRSGPGGQTVPPGTDDQFLIIQDSISGKDKGVGEDYAFFRVLPNRGGKLPHDLFGKINVSYPDQKLVQEPVANPLRVAGYGLDDEPAGDPPLFRNPQSQTQQTHSGDAVELTPKIIKHRVDTRGGNSGAPVLMDGVDPPTAVGIHTHGGCESEGHNKATSLAHPDVVKVLDR